MLDIDRQLKRLIRRALRRNRSDRYFTDHLAKRACIARLIAERAENGTVAIVYGGRDCDCVQVDNLVRIIPANVMEWERFAAEQDRNAEGPWWAQIAQPSDVRDLVSTERDLALEAFENGHPYTIQPVTLTR